MKKFLVVLTYLSITAATTNAQKLPKDTVTWSLARCIEYALANNINVKEAELNKEGADINYKQSKIERFPILNASATENISNNTSTESQTWLYNSTQVGVNTQVTLYNGGKITNKIKKNELIVQQNALYLEEEKNNIALSITQAYTQTLYAKEGIRIEENNLATSQKHLEQSKNKFDVHSISASELADIQTQYATSRYNLVAAQNYYAQQLLALKQLLEIEPGQPFDIEIPEIHVDSTIMVPEKNEIYRIATNFLPETKASNLGVDISVSDLKIARTDYIPSLLLNGGLSTGYSSGQLTSFGEKMYGNIGLTLSIPIFNNNRVRANIQNANISIQKAKLNTVAVNKELYKKIESTWQDFISTRSEMIALATMRDAANIAYELAQQQYDLGGLSPTDLLISQNNYRNAEQKLLQKKYEVLLNYIQLQFYQGKEIQI
jgi:outer membrane protein